MDTPVLVAEEVGLGRSLLDALHRNGLAVGLAAWVLDDEATEWRLMVAMPDIERSGTADAYRRLIDIAQSLESKFPVARLWLVESRDAGVETLSRFLRSESLEGTQRAGGVQIAARLVREAYIYDPRFVEYERQVVAALQRVLHDSVIRRSSIVLKSPPEGVDFVVGFPEGSLALVAVKGGDRPVPSWSVGELASLAASVPVILVSRAGLTEEAERGIADLMKFIPTRWQDSAEDKALAAAIQRARALSFARREE